MTQYDFTSHAEILAAIDALPDDKKEYNEQFKEIIVAAKAFLTTRTNSQLMDMKNTTPSFWDYEMFVEWFKEEEDTRNWPFNNDSRERLEKVYDSVIEEWAGDGSLEAKVKALSTQVAGIQKKMDKLTKLLTGTKVTLSVEDALKL